MAKDQERPAERPEAECRRVDAGAEGLIDGLLTADPIRIAYVTEVWRPSGNGIVTRLEATFHELLNRGHSLLVVGPANNGQGFDGVTVVGAPTARARFLYGGQAWGLPLPRLMRALDAFAPDLVHVVNPVLLGWVGVHYARRRRFPLVCSYHTHVFQYARYYRLGALERFGSMTIRTAHSLADVNLVTSHSSSLLFATWGMRARLWRGGVDRSLFRPRAARTDMRARLTDGHPDRSVVLLVGRLAREKNIERLAPLAQGHRHLALVGDGPARDELRAAFAGRQVAFTGWLTGDDLAAAYASADVLVSSSTTETLGLAILEARGIGLPIVAVRSPASSEILEDAYGARLVEPDDGDALVEAVDGVLREAPDRDVIAAEARASTATWSQATDDLLAHYQEARQAHALRAAARRR